MDVKLDIQVGRAKPAEDDRLGLVGSNSEGVKEILAASMKKIRARGTKTNAGLHRQPKQCVALKRSHA
jgi:hypothetical protein